VSEDRHIVVAPDKFKGSLTAPQAAAAIGAGLRRYRRDLRVRLAPVADGGDGTLEAVAGCGFSLRPVVVSGPTGEPVKAVYGVRDGIVLVELAEASGLRRLPQHRPDPMHASSRGTGELIRAALQVGCDQVILGLGGSACTDGGAGMLQALGVRLLDRQGRELPPGGAALLDLHTVDLDGLHPALHPDLHPVDVDGLHPARIVLASDVDNPLLGSNGAAAVYGPQKGASAAQVTHLEYALQRWAEVLAETLGSDLSKAAGAGAAGGVGFAAMAVLEAEARGGIELVLDLIRFERLLPGARLVITGEGSLDRQSLHGKAPIGVAAAAARHRVATIAVAGRSSLTAQELQAAGLRAAYPLTSLEPDPAICLAQAGRLLEQLVATIVAPAWLRP
jgi:glycerate kinase